MTAGPSSRSLVVGGGAQRGGRRLPAHRDVPGAARHFWPVPTIARSTYVAGVTGRPPGDAYACYRATLAQRTAALRERDQWTPESGARE